jgi:hypothetical protein
MSGLKRSVRLVVWEHGDPCHTFAMAPRFLLLRGAFGCLGSAALENENIKQDYNC